MYNRLLVIAEEQGRSLGPFPYGSTINHAPAPIAMSSVGSGAHRSVSYVSDATDMLGSSRPSPQYLRAYNLWYQKDMPLQDICAALRTRENPLKESTVMCVSSSMSCDGFVDSSSPDPTSSVRCKQTPPFRFRWTA